MAAKTKSKKNPITGKVHRHRVLDPKLVTDRFYDASVKIEQLRRSDDPRLLPIKAALVAAMNSVDSKLDYCDRCGAYFAKR